MSQSQEKPRRLFNFSELPSKIVVTLVIHILLALTTYLISLFAAIRASYLFKLSHFEMLLLIVAVSLLVLAVIFYFFRHRYAKNIPQFDATFSDFDVIEKEFTHQYLEKEKIIHTRRWKLKALRNGLDNFKDKFFWTGGKWEIKCNKEDHRITPNGNINLYEYYIYHFDRVLKKNDIIEIEVEWVLVGPHKWFMSTPIEEPTERLVLNIIFPLEWNIKKVHKIISTLQASKISDQTEVELKHGNYSWAVKKPKLLHHYELKWALKA